MRRRFLRSLAALAACGASPFALAQGSYPDHAVRVLVPFPPGGSVDPVARLLAAKLNELLGQPFVIDNKPGGNTAIAAQMVAKAPPDGYTLLFTAEATHLIHTLQSKLPYDSLKDFAPVAAISRSNWMLAVHASVPVKTLPEFIAYAKANPGKLNYASSGVGNANHLGGELFNQRAGTKIVHVPYKGGGPALQDLVSGRVQMMFSNVPVLQPQVDAGVLRALAYTTLRPGGPALPTFAQYGMGDLESMDSINVLLAPAGTPPAIVAQLSAAVQKALVMPDVVANIENQMMFTNYVGPQELAQRMRADRNRFADVIEQGHIVLSP